jgi:hypothetical protein
MPFLPSEEVDDCFVEGDMSEAPDSECCVRLPDFLVQNYVTSESKFLPCMWAANPDDDVKRTNNGSESFYFIWFIWSEVCYMG